MKNELKEIKKNLKATLTGFNDAKKEYGYDLANETYYVKQALKQVNSLLLRSTSNQKEHLYEVEMKMKPMKSGDLSHPNEVVIIHDDLTL